MVQPSARQLLEVVRFRPMIDTHAPARILAIEPDPGIGAVLHRILDKRVRGVLEVAPTIDAALASVARHVPDVILTSTFLPPADLARLIGELRRRDDAMHTQIISTPHALEAPDGPFYDDSGRILRFPRQRSHRGAFHCDPLILRNQVEQYLDHAHALRLAPNRQQHGLIPIAGPGLDGWRYDRASASTALVVPTTKAVRALNAALRPSDRRAASRRRAADLAGQWGVKLDSDGSASIVDISRTGVRLETATDLNPGSVITLELIGIEASLSVGARLIRSEAVRPDGTVARYHAAAKFLREVDLFPTSVHPIVAAAAAASSYMPTVLADLLGRVLADANWVSNGPALRSLFETEVGALVRAKDVRIRAVPVRASGGCQSLYFSIPTVTGPRFGLHVVFERGYRPTAAEFVLLKAAASLAAVVLDLTPAGETPSVQ
jgi:CheY-like chemotaxis protein